MSVQGPNFGWRDKVPMIFQDETAECGIACLAMVSGYYGYVTDLISMRQKYGVSLRGMSVKTLAKHAEALDLQARPLRVDIDDLTNLRLPAILHWSLNHFVVLTKIERRGVKLSYLIHDPSQGKRKITASEISAHFSGVLIELRPSATFVARRDGVKLTISQLWGRSTGLASSAFKIFVLAAIIELLALAAPLYMQIAIDTIAPAQDLDMLLALALSFGLMCVLSNVTEFVRSWSVINLTSEFSFRIASNLFRQMSRLPVEWFQKRSVGDVISRFNSSEAITDLIGNGLIQGLIDGLMATATLALMTIYSTTLTGIALVALTAYVALRVSYFRLLKAKNIGLAQAQAGEQSLLIETIRGITPLRLFARELERMRVWQGRRVAAVNAGIRIKRLQALFGSSNSLIMGLENVVSIYVAIRMHFSGNMSIGTIVAFAAYRHQFLSAAINAISRIVDYKMLDVQLARLADIALSNTDPGTGNGKRPTAPRFAIERIELRNVRYRYAVGEPDVLSGINLDLRAGECVVIMGASGGGKSTLLKIILGLIEPTAGEIIVNGKALTAATMASYRQNVGAAMQDDTLFAGTLAENISFFDPQADIERVKRAAGITGLNDYIDAIPMGLDSLVGDMGASLSGGQRQRVLLARALYHEPSFLVIDEGTANLDLATERRISQSLDSLRLLRLVVTHRPEATSGADRCFLLSDGRLHNLERRKPSNTLIEPSSI